MEKSTPSIVGPIPELSGLFNEAPSPAKTGPKQVLREGPSEKGIRNFALLYRGLLWSEDGCNRGLPGAVSRFESF